MSAERLQQQAEMAVKRMVNLSGEYRHTLDGRDDPISVREMPTGKEFLIEVKVLPCGEADDGEL